MPSEVATKNEAAMHLASRGEKTALLTSMLETLVGRCDEEPSVGFLSEPCGKASRRLIGLALGFRMPSQMTPWHAFGRQGNGGPVGDRDMPPPLDPSAEARADCGASQDAPPVDDHVLHGRAWGRDAQHAHIQV